ncbi:MAG: aldose epimerase family protein [Spirochaetota bacterium]
MTITKSAFGALEDGQEVEKITVSNEGRMTMEVMTYGATLLSLKTPDRDRKPGEITLGFNSLEGYTGQHPYFGATVGRVANRIARAQFSLGARKYSLSRNDGENHLHGGTHGFNRHLWDAEVFAVDAAAGVVFRRVSPHLEENYPGKLTVAVTYTLTDHNELILDYEATTTKATPVSLTNHTYWNLSGPEQGNILHHDVQLHCDQYLPVGEGQIPTGEILDVSDTPMDFRKAKRVGSEIDKVAGGYDHCYVVGEKREPLNSVAMVWDRNSGRAMEVLTTMPGIQFYTGNMLNGIPGRQGTIYKKHSGLCLETQHFPNAVNESSFPSCILKPRERYRHQTVYRFYTR